MKPHKHRDLIIAWANGAIIEFKNFNGEWKEPSGGQQHIGWGENVEYRIKPEPQWFEEIPPQGVLCWVWDEHRNNAGVVVVQKFNPGFHHGFMTQHNYYRNAEPLSNDEIRQFLRGEE